MNFPWPNPCLTRNIDRFRIQKNQKKKRAADPKFLTSPYGKFVVEQISCKRSASALWLPLPHCWSAITQPYLQRPKDAFSLWSNCVSSPHSTYGISTVETLQNQTVYNHTYLQVDDARMHAHCAHARYAKPGHHHSTARRPFGNVWNHCKSPLSVLISRF
jgi:hypothetical protein